MSGAGVHAFWPGWVSGVVLAALIVAYFWITGRLVSSSGRVSILIDRLRQDAPDECEASPEDLIQALRLASIERFGASAVHAQLERQAAEPKTAEPRAAKVQPSHVRPRANLTWVGHLLFLVGLALGGRLSRPDAPLAWTLGDSVGASWVAETFLPGVLLLAGLLVGFGTRMAGGCPIGHGLCGMARGQAGSWASGLAFFAAGVGLWLFLGGP